jgi:hypothetical protein
MRVTKAYGLAALGCGIVAGNYCWLNPSYDYCFGFGINCISMFSLFVYLMHQERKYNNYKKTDIVPEDQIFHLNGDLEETYQDSELLAYTD